MPDISQTLPLLYLSPVYAKYASCQQVIRDVCQEAGDLFLQSIQSSSCRNFQVHANQKSQGIVTQEGLK